MNQTVYLERQTCVMTERTENEEVYIVVKQTNFLLCLTSMIPLQNADIQCELYYDLPTLKPVPYVNNKPILHKFQQVSPEEINVECKLTVLSSKHEDMNFRIKCIILNNGEVIGEVLSHPIRCASKIDQAKKAKLISQQQSNEMKKPKKAFVSETGNTLTSTMNKMNQLNQSQNNHNNLHLSNQMNQSFSQTKICELAMLSANTILLERLREMSGLKEEKIDTFEYGMQLLCQKMMSLEYKQLQFHLMNIIGGLTIEQINILFEICTVIQSLYPQQYMTFQQDAVFQQNPFPFGEFNGDPSGQQNVFGSF